MMGKAGSVYEADDIFYVGMLHEDFEIWWVPQMYSPH